MLARALISLSTAAAACATWTGLPATSSPIRSVVADPMTHHAARPSESVFTELLPAGNPMIPALDRAYSDLERAMRPHGCIRCHAPDDPASGRTARLRHASQLLESRRALVPMLRANLMPPATDEHPAGISDEATRNELIDRARTFQTLADYALE